jgi:pyruvate/2-oxoglutarate dehydrogenase complex dihydrolipoamide acyltransferase (E2) component
MVGRRIARVAAFAREEAEDMWAEAQNMRQQNDRDPGAAAGQVVNATGAKAEETRDNSRQSAATSSAEDGAREQRAASKGEMESIKATETARRLAGELDVDLRQVEGTGAGGQITAADVRRKSKANYVA